MYIVYNRFWPAKCLVTTWLCWWCMYRPWNLRNLTIGVYKRNNYKLTFLHQSYRPFTIINDGNSITTTFCVCSYILIFFKPLKKWHLLYPLVEILSSENDKMWIVILYSIFKCVIHRFVVLFILHSCDNIQSYIMHQ